MSTTPMLTGVGIMLMCGSSIAAAMIMRGRNDKKSSPPAPVPAQPQGSFGGLRERIKISD